MIHDDTLRFGACWYPEQWRDHDRMLRDVAQMRAVGMDCVRVFEGAWATIEPQEDRFDWELCDTVIEACVDAGLGVIIGTPTYAAPAWLHERYPEAIATRQDGSPWYRPSRRLYDYTDPNYRHRCRSVVTAMAERYASHPAIWAWQLDNEMWCHLDRLWGGRVRTAFQDWLRAEYEDIAELNHAWGLYFWSNQVDDFHQIDLPGPTPAHQNHHQMADYLQFLSDLACGFLGEQATIITAVNPEAQVLHNCPFGPIDRAALLSRLDIYGHDHYPSFAADAAGKPAFGLNFGRFRAHARRLWVVEQESSQGGQTAYRLPTNPPGAMSSAAVQSIGHGANLLCWFRWRSFPAAQETNWGGLLPHWGEPGRHLREAERFIAQLRPHGPTIAAAKPQVTVARVLSFRQQLAHQVEPWITSAIGDPEGGRTVLRALHLNENHVRVADLEPGDGYQVALIPHAIAIDDDDVFRLTRWVEAGGELVIGPLAGYRDDDLHGPWHEAPPGALAPLTGTNNLESTTWCEDVLVHGVKDGQRLSASPYAEILEPQYEEVEVVATYLTDWLTGRPAITVRTLGAGRVFHCGCALNDVILRWLWQEQHLPIPDMAVVTHEAAAEVLTRSADDYHLHMVINHGPRPAVFHVRRILADLLTGEAVTNSFTLSPCQWRVLREYLT